MNAEEYKKRVAALEAEGLCTSDAQAIVDMEEEKNMRDFVRSWQSVNKRARMGRGFTVYMPDRMDKNKLGLEWQTIKGRRVMRAFSSLGGNDCQWRDMAAHDTPANLYCDLAGIADISA